MLAFVTWAFNKQKSTLVRKYVMKDVNTNVLAKLIETVVCLIQILDVVEIAGRPYNGYVRMTDSTVYNKNISAIYIKFP
jgi:hypothetical protein